MVQAPALMRLLIVVLAAWLAREQEGFIEYLKAENRMLKARRGRRRIIFTDAERCRSSSSTPEGGAGALKLPAVVARRPSHCRALPTRMPSSRHRKTGQPPREYKP